jgi:DNA-binding Lrp family transcriptional regulator
MAYILINTKIGAEREVLDALRETEGVQEAFGLLGVYDIIARVRADTTDRLTQIISDQLLSSKVHSKLTVVIAEA